MDKLYLSEFINYYPQFIFDQKYLKMPYASIEDIDLRSSKLDEYISLFNDVFWIIKNINDLELDLLLTKKNQIIKSKLSLEELTKQLVF